jgi:CRP/FNR family transcriptional regulator
MRVNPGIDLCGRIGVNPSGPKFAAGKRPASSNHYFLEEAFGPFETASGFCSMTQPIENLRHSHQPHAGHVESHMPSLASLAPAQVYPAGIELFQQGASVQEAYLIESGMVKLCHTDDRGNELILGLRFPRWFLGSAALILHRRSAVTVTTLTRCELHRIAAEAFMQMIRMDSLLSWQIHEMHSCELLDQVEQLAQLGTLSSRQRLEQVLGQLISALRLDQSPRDIRLNLPLKHWELARLIAVTPEHLSRLLKQMEGDGLIRREKGWVVVSDLGRRVIVDGNPPASGLRDLAAT